MDEEVAQLLRLRASEAGQPVSQYLCQLIRESEDRKREQLAEEGYRLLSEDSLKFAEMAGETVAEVWSDW